MSNEQYISLQVICSRYELDMSFVDNLYELGLIDIVRMDESQAIHSDQLSELEKMVRLNQELGVNTEGIAIILELLARLDSLQQELSFLKGRIGNREEE